MKNYVISQTKSSLNDWLFYIEKLHNKIIDMDLTRINEVALRLDILNPAAFIFSVAGTNGKSSTCRVLETILIEAGYKVGVYTSPHLIRYTERVRIQNSELLEVMHISSFIKIEDVRGDISLTYFEYSTLSALWLFKKSRVDIIILEVGLGGRLDATNIIDSDVAVITNIAIDHIDWLGPNRESIGQEKSGIFRTGKPAVIGEIDIPNTIKNIAQEKQTKLFCRNIDWNIFIESKNTWSYNDQQGQLTNLPIPYLPLDNVATALAALRISSLKVNKKAIYKGIQSAILPGRFQVISHSPRLIIDVAHNPHAAKYLVERLKLTSKTGRILAVIGMLRDKDIGNTIFSMEEIVNSWYYASLNNSRGEVAEQLTKYLNNGRTYNNVVEAWYTAMTHAYLEDTVVVFGSFHTVAHVMKVINSHKINIKSIF